MKKINIRFCMITAGVAVVAATVLHLVHEVQVRRHAGFFLNQADAALENDNAYDAVNNLRRYLELEPDDADAVARLGFVLADAGALRRAYGTLERAIRLDPTLDRARRRLVEIALRMNRHRDAREHLQRHLLETAPEDAELLGFLARCQAADQQYLEAAHSFKRAIDHAPEVVDHYLYLLLLLKQQPDVFSRNEPWDSQNADYWVDRMVEANPRSPQALLARGQYRYRAGKFEAALTDCDRALALQSDAPEALLLAADSLVRLERYDEARRRASRALDVVPEHPRVYTTLAGIELNHVRPKAAIDWLKRGVRAVKTRSTIPVRLVRLLLASQRYDEAERIVASLTDRDYPQGITMFLQAQIDYHRGQWRRAKRRLLEIRSTVSESADLTKELEHLLGQTYEKLGDLQRAANAYKKAIAVDRAYAPPRAALVELLHRMGRYEEAAEQQRALAGLKGVALALPQQARLLISRTLALPPEQRDWAPMQQLLAEMESDDTHALAAALLHAEMLLAQERPGAAEKALRDACAKFPDQTVLYAGLARLADGRGDHDEAKQWLEKASQSDNDSVNLRLTRASHVLESTDASAARSEALVALSRNVQGFDSRQRLGLWKGLLQLAISGGEIEAADTIAQAALDAIPNDLPLCELAFKAALRLKAPERAAARLDRIHRIQGPGPLWHFCRALQLAELPTTESPQYAEALNHLAEAARQRPAWSAVSMLQARIHDRLGDLPQATELYLKAFEHGASDASAVRRAVELLYAQQRYAEAGELLAAVHTRQHTGDADFQRMKSQLLGRLNQLDDALDLARNVAEQSQNYRDHLWLGNLLMVHGLRQRAEGLQDQSKRSLDEASAALKRAAKLEPTAPGPWVARVELLARTGRFEEAEQALADLQAHVAQEDAPRALANANVILGRFEQAQECFASALDAAPEDIGLIRTVAEFGMRTGRFELAEGPLRRLATGHIEATPQQRRWSRRALATWLAQTGRYPDLQEALRLVAENLAEEPSSVADRRAKADLLARHPRPSKRQEAAHLLEALVDSPQANDEDRWNLVQLHAAEQRWERAVPHLRVLSRPDALRMYVRYLIDSGALEEAKLRLRQLQRASPDDFATFAASTELSFHAGEIEEILRRIDRRSGDADTPAETLALIQLVDNYARQLTDNQSTMLAERFQSKAQTLLDAFLETHPENSLAAVAYLARWGQAERVLVMLEEALADRPGAQFAAAARDVVAPLASQPQAQGRLIDLLQRAAEKHGRTPQLLLLLATLHQAAERYDRLEAVYSELLKQQPENVLILNGLAELLALQNTQPRRALDLIDRAIRLGGPRPMFLDTRASVYRALGQPQKAIEDMEIVVAEEPRPNRYAHLAMAYAQANRPEQAKAAAEKAMGVDATMPGDEPEGQTAAPPVAEQLHPLERTAFADLLKRLK